MERLIWLGMATALFFSATLFAAERTEIVQMKYRMAKDVAEALAPLYDGEKLVIKGFDQQLILRGEEALVQEALSLIPDLDQPIPQLLIKVRQGLNRQLDEAKIGLCGEFVSGDIDVRMGCLDDQRHADFILGTAREDNNSAQTIRVLSGGIGKIQAGQEVPFINYFYNTSVNLESGHITASGSAIDFKPVMTGLYVRPTALGSHVRLEISTNRQALSRRQHLAVESHELVSTIVIPMGTWVELGGSRQHIDQSQTQTLYRTTERRDDNTGIWIYVEAE